MNKENNKPRYIFLTTMLGISCFQAALGILISICQLLSVVVSTVTVQDLLFASHTLVSSLLLLIFSIALIKWKKWGIWGYTLLTVGNCIYFYCIGWDLKVPLQIIFLGLVYLSLFIGKDKAWSRLTQ